jgi:AraC-like DNA-binding protein
VPTSVVYTAGDPCEYGPLIRAADINVLVAAKGDFRAKVTRIDLDRVWMQRGEENLPRIFRSVLAKDRVAVFFVTEASCPVIRLGGLETSSRQIAILSPGQQSPSRSLGAAQWCSMSLPTEDFMLWSRVLTGQERVPPDFPQVLTPPPPMMSRLQQLHSSAGRLAETSPEVIATPEAARNLEDTLIGAMFACMATGAVQNSVTTRHRGRILAQFEALLEANPDRALSMAEVCATVGVPGRTLRACCAELLGMSPKQYLDLRRMHLAHRALLYSNMDSLTVTEIATRYGFWELGRFAVAYARLFGESPSNTLKRAPEGSHLRPKRLPSSHSQSLPEAPVSV